MRRWYFSSTQIFEAVSQKKITPKEAAVILVEWRRNRDAWKRRLLFAVYALGAVTLIVYLALTGQCQVTR